MVSSKMKAEIAGENFVIHEQGPREQLYIFNGETQWTWHVVPESSGRHMIKFYLHLLTSDDGKVIPMIVDVADVNIVVIANPAEWIARNWGWLAGVLALIMAGWRLRSRFIAGG